jgi:hypothetical protein
MVPSLEFFKTHSKSGAASRIEEIVKQFLKRGWDYLGANPKESAIDVFFARPWKPRVALKDFPEGIKTVLIMVEPPYAHLFTKFAKSMKWILRVCEEGEDYIGYTGDGLTQTRTYAFIEEWEIFRASYSEAVRQEIAALKAEGRGDFSPLQGIDE